jgi:hypothetical protein
MVKRTPPSKKLYRRRITRIRASPAALIGYVEAPVQEQTIRAAIRQFEITNPEHQKRLVAQQRNRASHDTLASS